MDTNVIFSIIIFIYFIIVCYYFYKNIFINNLNQRIHNGLEVFRDQAYNIQWNDFQVEYFNPFYQENMPLKVADFYWASSRKSYLPIGESWDFPAYEAIQKVLDTGARLIHLDIYSQQDSVLDANAIPVVRNRTINPLATALNFKQCLQVISENAWTKNPNYPLILYLEIHTTDKDSNGQPVYNKNVLIKIGQTILEIFSNKLINKIYGFNGRSNNFPLGQINISDILGKIAIITNVYPTIGILNELTNGVVNKDQQFIRLIPYSEVNLKYGGLQASENDPNSLIQHNYKYLTLVSPVSQTSLFNFFEPKDDLYNIPAEQAWKMGCQMVLMNYQLLDSNLRDYLKMFSNSSLVLKPDTLRLIPKPRPVSKKQNPQLYFTPRTVEEKGWFNFTI
jgi:hypothetical protein